MHNHEACVICRSRKAAEADKNARGLIIHDVMQKPDSIIVLWCFFFRISEKTPLWVFKVRVQYTEEALGNFELVTITECLQILGHHVTFTRYCILTVCSWPIKICIISLTYDNSYLLSARTDRVASSLRETKPWLFPLSAARRNH